MSSPVAVVLDHTAILALGAGHQLVSALVAQAHAGAERYVYAPAMCLAAAAARPGLAEHLGVLPAVNIADLDYLAATAVGALIARDLPWQLAHAAHASQPSAEWPAGAPVLTATPDAYHGLGVDVITLDRARRRTAEPAGLSELNNHLPQTIGASRRGQVRVQERAAWLSCRQRRRSRGARWGW